MSTSWDESWLLHKQHWYTLGAGVPLRCTVLLHYLLSGPAWCVFVLDATWLLMAICWQSCHGTSMHANVGIICFLGLCDDYVCYQTAGDPCVNRLAWGTTIFDSKTAFIFQVSVRSCCSIIAVTACRTCWLQTQTATDYCNLFRLTINKSFPQSSTAFSEIVSDDLPQSQEHWGVWSTSCTQHLGRQLNQIQASSGGSELLPVPWKRDLAIWFYM